MVYFFILPAFLVCLLLQVVLFGATVSIPALRPARTIVMRILIGSSAGFLAANALLMAATVLPFGAYNAAGCGEQSWVFKVLGGLAVFGLTIGPVLASVLGFGFGTAAGIRSSIRSNRPVG